MSRSARAAVRLLAALIVVLAAACNGPVVSDPGAASFAGRGRSGFFDTLFGIVDRDVESVALLESAVAHNPQDGESYFLLGLLHLLRFSRDLTDPYSASDVLKQEINGAAAALDAAAPLLPKDRRVAGFRAAATYVNGVIGHDDTGIALGMTQLRDALALIPQSKTFDFIGTVVAMIPARDPLYQEILQNVGAPLSLACSPFKEPERCGNAGTAPHNVEGTMVLFGDIFAKAGDRQQAESYYRLALSRFPTSGGPWRFQSMAEDRLRSVAERVALYRDDDPSNDPTMLGLGRAACAVCHYR